MIEQLQVGNKGVATYAVNALTSGPKKWGCEKLRGVIVERRYQYGYAASRN